jgi:bifunctional enzyme CysN/CysC
MESRARPVVDGKPLAPLSEHAGKTEVRFLTCGSVDDGKSTLIGRILCDTHAAYDDQIREAGGDLARLVDGLKAEREQGITIDVAYRYFTTLRRKFVIADCPGHEQYTRNMATGASQCDLAVILIDARKGVLPQTRRHSLIVSLLGIRHVIVAVNKMDLVDYAEARFDDIVASCREMSARLQVRDLHFVPLSALCGDNVVEPSARMPWYRGGTLMHLLDHTHVASDRNLIDLRLPVQWACRPDGEFRGIAGTLASGVLRRGDPVVVLPAGTETEVQRIVTFDGDIDEAYAPMAVMVVLKDNVDSSRGDVIAAPGNRPQASREVDAMLVWMANAPLQSEREYVIKHTTTTAPCRITKVVYQLDIHTGHRKASAALALNQIGRVSVRCSRTLLFDAYAKNRETGAFILIDRIDNSTVAAGMILEQEAAAADLWTRDPAPQARCLVPASARPPGKTLLLTGLSGSGKSSLARALEQRLFAAGRSVLVLDGEELRAGICKDLGFTAPERSENLRRAAEIARLCNDAGIFVIGAFVAPQADARARVQARIGAERCLLVHLDCPIEVCRRRDSLGLYAAADRGDIERFPGVSAPYDAPEDAAVVLDSARHSVAENVDKLMGLLGA